MTDEEFDKTVAEWQQRFDELHSKLASKDREIIRLSLMKGVNARYRERCKVLRDQLAQYELIEPKLQQAITQVQSLSKALAEVTESERLAKLGNALKDDRISRLLAEKESPI